MPNPSRSRLAFSSHLTAIFQAIKAVLDRYDIQLFVDEVVTGFGRCGTLWDSEAMGLEPDTIACAKCITGAYLLLAALIIGERSDERLERGSDANGWFAQGETHQRHTVSADFGLEVFKIFERRDILGQFRPLIPYWNRMLDRMVEHPLVKGRRALWPEGRSGARLGGQPGQWCCGKPHSRWHQQGGYEAGLEHGIIVRPLSGCVVMAPPLIITATEIDELALRLGAALHQVIADAVGRRLNSDLARSASWCIGGGLV